MEASNVMNNISNVSYLRARDPSILAFNRPGISEIRTNLAPELGSASNEIEPKENNNLRVYLRIKNVTEPDFDHLYEIAGDTLTSKVPPGSQCMIRNMKEGDSLRKMYTFSRIFPPETNQTEIFNTIVKPKVLDFINGENSTLFTYGASGSGKTFTVIGSDEEPGVVPRSLEYLFRTLPQLSKNPIVKPLPAGNVSILNESDCRKEKHARRNLLNASSLTMDKTQHVRTYTAMQQRLSREPVGLLEISSDVSITIWVSYAEIYNEQIFDLLTPGPPRGKQKPRLKLGTSNGRTYIKDLTQINVSSGLEAYQILQYGIHKLNCAGTNVNVNSSRSHSIFTIKLVQFSESNKDTYVSNFHFCDLAGSERLKKTLNVGDRLKESNNINNSLLVLGRCISAIRSSQKQHDNRLVPFRESKLTQLFQRALSGLEDMAMIVNISPKRDMFDETQHVLNFSAVAKDISIERKPVEFVFFKKNSRFSQMVESHNGVSSTLSEYEETIEELTNKVEVLTEELLQQQHDFEIREKHLRDYLTEGYEKIIKEMEVDAARKVRDAENCMEFRYEQKLKNMKSRYEILLQEAERNTIIQLDASDDEEVEELRREISDLKSRKSELEKIITRLSVENRTKDADIQNLKQMNAALKEENNKLKSDLQEGVDEYCELQKKFELKVAENLELTNKCIRLEDQLETCIEFSATRLIHEDDIDSCEDNKENEDPQENSENIMPSSENPF